MQHVENPVPRIKHPDWLHKVISERKSRNKQVNLGRFLKPGNHHNSNPGPVARDMEDTVQKEIQTIDCSASENVPVDVNSLARQKEKLPSQILRLPSIRISLGGLHLGSFLGDDRG
eukprot:jgi/Picre1/32297/NNA_007643.t1